MKHTGNDFSLLRFCFSVVLQFVLLSPTRIKTKTNGAGYATSAQSSSSPTQTHHSNQTFYKRQSFSADGQSLQMRDVIVQRGRSRSRRRPGHYACHTEASPPGVAAGLSQCKAKPPCSPPPPPTGEQRGSLTAFCFNHMMQTWVIIQSTAEYETFCSDSVWVRVRPGHWDAYVTEFGNAQQTQLCVDKTNKLVFI